MQLEYLPDGSPDCPLIRLYDFDSRAVMVLRGLVVELAHGARRELAVHDLPDVEALAGCQLVLEVGTQDLGVIPGRSPNSFRCILRDASWDNVAGLIEPFCEPGPSGGFQWLSDESKVSLLLSRDGHW
jgi:hypothetical protein